MLIGPHLEHYLNEAVTICIQPKAKPFAKSGAEETHFAKLKANQRFQRLTHSIIEKIKVEVGLHFIAQNIEKLYQIFG